MGIHRFLGFDETMLQTRTDELAASVSSVALTAVAFFPPHCKIVLYFHWIIPADDFADIGIRRKTVTTTATVIDLDGPDGGKGEARGSETIDIPGTSSVTVLTPTPASERPRSASRVVSPATGGRAGGGGDGGGALEANQRVVSPTRSHGASGASKSTKVLSASTSFRDRMSGKRAQTLCFWTKLYRTTAYIQHEILQLGLENAVLLCSVLASVCDPACFTRKHSCIT